MQTFQNLYEVRKTVRFSMLKQNYEDFYKFDENILKDIDFLNSLLDFEDEILKIKKKSNSKLLQDLIDEKDGNILISWIEKSFQIIKNQICTVIYNKTVYDTKPSVKNKSYENILEMKTGRKFEYFLPKNYFRDNYIPEEDFNKVKDSEIWYAIKFIATLIRDNELIGFGEKKDLREKLSKIKKYNPNWENFFELQTLNPFTTNRWKIDELENNYKIAFAEYEKQLGELNKKGKIICESILKDEIFKNAQGKILYFKNIYGDCLNACKKENLDVNHLLLLINKFDSLNDEKKTGFTKNDKLEKDIKELNKKLRELNKTISEMNGYKIHLLENYQTEKFSFLMQSGNYYFVGTKSFENGENNVSDFQEFVGELQKGDDKLYYLDSMTFGGFKKLFISKYSDIIFEDKTNIKAINNEILETEKQIILKKENLKKEIIDFKDLIIKENTSNEENKIIEVFLSKINKTKKDLVNEIKTKKFNKKENKVIEIKKKYFNNFYYEDLKNHILTKFDLETLEKQYCELIKDLLVKIKDKKYKVGGEIKDLSFLGNDLKNKTFDTLEDLKNYFNDSGYKVVEKNINFDNLLKQTKNGDLEIFQIKSKDMPFHKDFINKNNCGKENEAKNIKSGESKKDLNTMYFESFFEDLKKGNKYARIGADFKVRGISSSSKNDYTKFWGKEKNQARHKNNKENIENFQNRFKRDRFFIDFSINLNATNHIAEDKLNKKIVENLKTKIQEGEKIKILSLDHGESSFLTYKIFEVSNGDFSQIKEINGGNFDNFQEVPKGENSKDKKQEIAPIDEKEKKYQEQGVLENYITKYHSIIQDKKRERQIEEALKNFARNAISKIKEIISNDTLPKNQNGISEKTLVDIKKILQNFLNDKKEEKNEKTYFVIKESIYYFLEKFKFDYSKYNFAKSFPDQENLKAKIDKYILGIQKLLEDDDKLRTFCNQIKESFDGVSEADFVKLYKTPFYSYKSNFSLQLKQINNLKDGYASVLVGYISKLLMNGDINMICLEDNLLSYGVDQSKSFQNHMGTENQSTFAQALINKLSFCLDKNDGKNYQFCYPVKATETNKFKGKNNGVLFFVDENITSKECPKCGKTLNRDKGNGEDHLFHNEKIRAGDLCNEKSFEIKKSINKKEIHNGIEFKDGDDLATYNIAKKGIEYLESLQKT